MCYSGKPKAWGVKGEDGVLGVKALQVTVSNNLVDKKKTEGLRFCVGTWISCLWTNWC